MGDQIDRSSATLRGQGVSSSSVNDVPDPSSAISSSLDELVQKLLASIAKCKEDATRECAELRNQNTNLGLQLALKSAAVDELLRENKQIKDQLRNSACGSISPKPAGDQASDPVPINENAPSTEDIETLRKHLRLERERTSRYYQACKRLKDQRETDKATMAQWRSFVQRHRENLSPRKFSNDSQWHFITQLESLMESQARSTGGSASTRTEQPPASKRASSLPAQVSQTEPQKQSESGSKDSTKDHCKDTLNAISMTEISSSTDSLPARPNISLIREARLDRATESTVLQSSQSTEAESQPLQTRGSLAQDDTEGQGSDPVFISARCLRRKRQEDKELPDIKPEPTSSPLPSFDLAALFPAQQVDLDEVLPSVVTPRKRRRIGMAEGNRETKDSSETSRSRGPQERATTSLRRSSMDNTALEPQKMHDHRDLERPSRKPEHPLLKPTGSGSLVGHSSGLVDSVKAEHSPERRALRPLSVNTPTFSPKTLKGEKPRSSPNDLPSHQVTEEQYLASKSDAGEGSFGNNPVGHRVKTLLETPFSDNKQLLTPRSRSGTSMYQKAPHSVARKQPIGISKSRPQSNSKAQRQRNEAPETRPEDEPLRARPYSHIGLEDFRVNPKHNRGYTFAYNEVIRGRARQCLPGCTRPDCCGNQFRKMVEIGGLPPTPQGLWDSSQDVKDADDRLLEQYLGDDEAWRLRSMTDKEKEQLLVEAKALALQKSYGKHRVAFPRSRTPPGFWRCDMPSTQEREADRALSEKMTREKIAERWREAMKPDGMWKFRDE